MKRGIYLYLEIDIIKAAQKKGLNLSQIANEALKQTLINPKPELKAPSPEKNLSQTYFSLPRKFRIKAEERFSREQGGLIPNYAKKEHLEKLIKIYHELTKQTKINLNENQNQT